MNDKFNIKIGYVLRYGVFSALIFSIIGIFTILFLENKNIIYTKSFSNIYSFTSYNINHFNLISFLFIPIIIMIITPISRVFLSIFLFIKEQDYKFVAITSVVFIILMISIFIIS